MLTSFTVLFSERGLDLQRFLVHENIQVMNLRNYEIDALCDFQLLHLLVNLGSFLTRKVKSGMLPRFDER